MCSTDTSANDLGLTDTDLGRPVEDLLIGPVRTVTLCTLDDSASRTTPNNARIGTTVKAAPGPLTMAPPTHHKTPG